MAEVSGNKRLVLMKIFVSKQDIGYVMEKYKTLIDREDFVC